MRRLLLAFCLAQTVTVSTVNQTGGTTAAVINDYVVDDVVHILPSDGGIVIRPPLYVHDDMPTINGDDGIVWFKPVKCSHVEPQKPDSGITFGAVDPKEPACLKYWIYPALVDGGVVWKCIGDCR